ncbi:1-phosphofructokinase [Microbacterium protaetiae]|uniref:1-phosphofructokinase n=1 Tax=Microbacterium protaetiae TaxID=2509458 RepID=A0A4P6EUM6_9MICO|nr:1-phosphofructokinase [Microbacterium protaetiae]QAY61738.1 1-phosphofructokinase [Microbacterium protaetiae]
MIVTVTANPSLDRTIVLDAPLQPGAVQAAASTREDAGGKGINVARVLAAAGASALAVLPLAEGDPYGTVLTAERLAARTVPVAGHCRANVTITDPAGVTTKLNLPGEMPSADELTALQNAVVETAEGARWVVLAGSLPPGVPDDFYAQVITAVRERWGAAAPRMAVDASGPALAAVVARAHPDLIKPNDDELAELTGVSLDAADADVDALTDANDLAQAAARLGRALVPAKVGAALITLGGRGAVLVTPDGAYAAVPPPTRVRSTVGAGDSSLAGYLLAESRGADPAACLVSSIRHGAAAASLPGTMAPRPGDLPTADIAVAHL